MVTDSGGLTGRGTGRILGAGQVLLLHLSVAYMGVFILKKFNKVCTYDLDTFLLHLFYFSIFFLK